MGSICLTSEAGKAVRQWSSQRQGWKGLGGSVRSGLTGSRVEPAQFPTITSLAKTKMDDGLHQSDYRELSPVSLWTDTSVQWSTDMFMWISTAEAPSIPAPVRTTSPVSSALSSPVSVRTTAAGAFSQAITRLFSGQSDMFMWISPAEAPSIPAPVRTTSPVSSALSSPVSVRTTAAGAFSQAIVNALHFDQRKCGCQ
ncbi:hypothetical protein DPEC_G00067680 [Dallia pectoralis]|uniref:Uncharacterized protein n=1 Tax=Dallia pectoralis TaxID=75939 RepID=A0ACC2H216_DALPE|nr:hypothetical protein DPEC_G00067680 [Dallia pectoralis]